MQLPVKPEASDPGGAGVAGGCEVPCVGAGKRARILWKSSIFSELLSHVSSFETIVLKCILITHFWNNININDFYMCQWIVLLKCRIVFTKSLQIERGSFKYVQRLVKI